MGDYLLLSKKKNKDGKSRPVYSVTNSQGFIPSEEYFSKEVYSKELRTYQVVKRNMIAYNPSRINVGSVALQNKESEVIVSPLYVVFSVDESRLLPGYVVSFLKSAPGLSQIEFRSTGTVRNTLKFDALCRLELSVPSIDEQRTRLGRLKSIEGQIELRKKYLEKLNDLVKSQFIEMFGNPAKIDRASKVKLGEVFRVRSSKRIYAKDQVKEGVPFYRLADIGSLIDGTIPDPNSFLSEARYQELKQNGQVPEPGDILVTARGTLGKCYIVEKGDRFYFQDGMISWLSRTGNSPLSEWIVALFDNDDFIGKLKESCSGTTVKYLSIADLADIEVVLPPLSLQREFAAFACEVDKLEFAARWGLRKCETACSVIMSELSSTNTVAGEMATGCSKAKGIAGLW